MALESLIDGTNPELDKRMRWKAEGRGEKAVSIMYAKQ